MKEVRLGIAGAGDVAERHLEGLLLAGGVKVQAIAEPVKERREAFQKAHGIPFATGDFKLLSTSKEIDAVLILTPHDLHESMTCEALRAGKDVICEKPMARSTPECDRMLDAARSSGQKLFITHSLREDFFFRTASRRIKEGALGRLLAGSFRWLTDELARLDEPGHWKGTKSRSGGGVLIDGGCHVADLGNALFGRACRAHAFGKKLVARRAEVGEDTAVFAVEYETGSMSSFLLTFTAGAGFRPKGGFAAGMVADLYGTEGHIQGGYFIRDADVRRWCNEARSGEPDKSHYFDGKSRPGDIDVSILRALRGEAPPPLTALDARNAVAVVEAAYQSIATGRVAEVDWRDD